MSPTTNDLRDRLAEDVATFGTLPGVADRALAQGRRTRRRRATVAGVLGTVVASVAVAALATGGTRTPAPPSPVAGPSSVPTPAPTASDVPQTEIPPMPTSDAWNQHVVETLSALLPQRFDDVSIHRAHREGGLPLFRVSSPTQQIEFFIVFGHGFGYDVDTCEPLVWWMSSCLPADLPAPTQARAFHEVVAPMEGTDLSDPAEVDHLAGAELGEPGLDATLTITPIGPDVPIQLTDEEIRSIVEDPSYLALVHEGAAIFLS